jgi:hypothetical protein
MPKYLGKGHLSISDTVENVCEGRWLTCAAGIDIHKHMAMATVLVADFDSHKQLEFTRKFQTTHASLQELKAWFL